MASVRRVVTGHDQNGHAVVRIDDVRGGADQWNAVVWTTDTTPASNNDERDGAEREVQTTSPGGSLCRYSEVPPHYDSRMHRTKTLDFGIVIEGVIEMELDGGEWVTLRAGDVVVQRGTNHAWSNKTDKPCRMFWAMVESEPITIDGKPLEITQI